MKIKVLPEDFVVREVARLPLVERGPYRVYLLEKKGWNTVDALLRIARAHGVPYRLFSYGGLKDRHAHTFQYVTFKGEKDLSLREKGYSLTSIGFMDRPMGPDLLEGNEFSIVLRALLPGEGEKIQEQIPEVLDSGFPNYFDDQRFGSYDREMGFMAERLLKRQYNGALQIYLTGIYPEEKREAKERKLFFRQNWGNWSLCLSRAKTTMEKKIFSLLSKNPKAYIEALRFIPGDELSLFFSAYQGYLFNQLLRRLLQSLGLDLVSVPGKVGPYLFYRLLKAEEREYLFSLELPLAASRMKFPDALTERLFQTILEERGLKRSSFNLRKIRQAFFKSTPRKAVVIPRDLSFTLLGADEIYSQREKALLSFKLPPGSYATMLIKRLSIALRGEGRGNG